MLKQVTNMGIFPRFWSEKKTLKPPIVQFLWLWIHYTLIDSFLLHCVPLSMESISIFSPSSIGGSPLSGLKFSVHSNGKPLHKTNKKHGDISRWSPWDTPKWSSPKFFIGLTPSPWPPQKKRKHGTIFRHIFHTEHPNMSAFGPFVDLLVSTPWRKCREVTDLGPR